MAAAGMLLAGGLAGCRQPAPQAEAEAESFHAHDIRVTETTMKFPVEKTDEEWRQILTPEQYHILREKGTERPHTGKYNDETSSGTYVCAGCGVELFESDMKFSSNCGWPSFDTAKEGRITELEDVSYGMIRTEVLCSNCGGHLGHVFDDGPTSTGLRYCINSASLDLKKK